MVLQTNPYIGKIETLYISEIIRKTWLCTVIIVEAERVLKIKITKYGYIRIDHWGPAIITNHTFCYCAQIYDKWNTNIWLWKVWHNFQLFLNVCRIRSNNTHAKSIQNMKYLLDSEKVENWMTFMRSLTRQRVHVHIKLPHNRTIWNLCHIFTLTKTKHICSGARKRKLGRSWMGRNFD